MFEKMNETEKWNFINMVIESVKEDGPFDIESTTENGMVFENGLPYCPRCGSTEYLFVEGYHCSGTVCVDCGYEDIDNNYY